MTTNGKGVPKDTEKAYLHIEFPSPQSSEMTVNMGGLNEIQIFGAAKYIEQIGIEHMARAGMERMMAEAKGRASDLIVPPRNLGVDQ